jgi:cytochrome P450
LIPLIQRLPKSWWQGWLFVLKQDWAYHDLGKAWEPFGDSFLVISPGKIQLFTRSAEMVRHITARREQFPKDTTDYSILRLFGDNVLTTEGAAWRFHRKVQAGSFNEKNAAHTFAEAISQTHGMIARWLGPDGTGRTTIAAAEKDTMTLALNIIAHVGFGLRLLWPGQSLPAGTDPKLARYGSLDPPPGHTMSFAHALESTLEYLLVLLIVPWPVLKRLPFKWAKASWEAKENYVSYMDEFLQDKIEEVRAGYQPKDSMDLMGQLVRSKYGKSSGNGGSELLDSDIVGNAFIVTVAGHETSANVMHFTFVELANDPAAQRAVQKDIDNICGRDSDPETWSFESVVNPLLASHVGASMNETLRLMPPVPLIPKHVAPRFGDQVMTIDGEKCMLPAGTNIGVSTVALHRNPRYWPSRPSRIRSGEDDVDDFVPERWFRSSTLAEDVAEEGGDTEDYGGYKGGDTSEALFRPTRGSFVPFSDGARSCLGRRIGQVEIIAALAVVFQRYSLELAVDEWASDEEVHGMSAEQRTALYRKAQEKCRATLRMASSRISLKLHGDLHVPLRLVKRGEERFINLIDTE